MSKVKEDFAKISLKENGQEINNNEKVINFVFSI